MPDNFKAGDAVAITGGCFKGFTGTVEGLRDGQLCVIIMIFGRATAVAVTPEYLRPKKPNDFDPPSSRL